MGRRSAGCRRSLVHRKASAEMVNSHGYDRCHRFDVGVCMELRHLRYFVALAEYLSFTRAAQRVHVTQSTLSHQIRQLEEELGQTLFDGIGTLKPSSRGLSGQLRIGTTHTFNIGLIPECVALFLTRHPGVQLRVEE